MNTEFDDKLLNKLRETRLKQKKMNGELDVLLSRFENVF